MGDRLRQLLYPLVLPVIVGTIWVCGWVRQQEDRVDQAVQLDREVARQASLSTAQAAEDDAADGPDDSEALATVGGADEP
jgi:hypothetical protein